MTADVMSEVKRKFKKISGKKVLLIGVSYREIQMTQDIHQQKKCLNFLKKMDVK